MKAARSGLSRGGGGASSPLLSLLEEPAEVLCASPASREAGTPLRVGRGSGAAARGAGSDSGPSPPTASIFVVHNRLSLNLSLVIHNLHRTIGDKRDWKKAWRNSERTLTVNQGPDPDSDSLRRSQSHEGRDIGPLS